MSAVRVWRPPVQLVLATFDDERRRWEFAEEDDAWEGHDPEHYAHAVLVPVGLLHRYQSAVRELDAITVALAAAAELDPAAPLRARPCRAYVGERATFVAPGHRDEWWPRCQSCGHPHEDHPTGGSA